VERSSPGAAAPAPAGHRALLAVPRVLVGAMWVVVAGYLAGLRFHGPHFEPFVDGWLGTITDVVPAALCWWALAGADGRRREIAALALAVTSFTAGDIAYTVMAASGRDVPFPSAADIGYMGFYPCALVAVAFAVRRELHRVAADVWLDSLLGGLGAAAVLAVVLDRVFDAVTGRPLAGGIALVYPIGDLVLLAAVTGIASLYGRRVPVHWLVLVAGLLVFAGVDTLSALSFTDDSYEVGGEIDVLWAVGLALFAHWCRGRPRQAGPGERSVALLMPTIATVASLGVLVVSGRTRVSLFALGVAVLTQLVALGRTQLAFHQLRRLADLRRQATTDELTGMPNRRAFYARAATQLGRGTPMALLLLDLDSFKEVNDSLGHHVGDQLLIQIGDRLGEMLRDGDVLARIGGDEFAILLDNVQGEQAVLVAEKVRAAVASPCTLEGIVLRTEVSIGVTLAPEHGTELSLLLRRADIAMYRAKKARDGALVYSGVDDTAGASRLRSIQELHTALDEDQMTLHYQPKLDLATDEVCDVEALIRWNHPVRGLLFPDSFLGLVEDAGLMRQLTQMVLEKSLDQAVLWQAEHRSITVAVNLSASSLVDTELPEHIAAMLAARGLPPKALQVEITEEFLMADRDRTRDILVRLREAGIQIAVDDFGTGYSSLAYLRELPIDELKLDRSFVFPMADDARAAALVFSTISLAHSLGLRMVAEGVENLASLKELADHGCDQAQGYYISRGLPPAELGLWLEERDRNRLGEGRYEARRALR
jgi:diguanylate cyclase (GGDEF)-like protein